MGDISNLSIAVGQMDVVAGQPSKNFETISRMIAEAKGAGADLIVFPEMCVGGYFLSDKWTDDAFVDYLDSFNDRIRALSDGIGIIFGNVGREYLDPAHNGTDGRPCRYNMAFFAHNGNWVPRETKGYLTPYQTNAVAGRYIKTLLPNYRMFDDARYFTSAPQDAAWHPALDLRDAYTAPFDFTVDGTTYRIGLEICEDLWSGDYPFNPTKRYVEDRCDAIINISTSPWTLYKDRGRGKRVAEHVRQLGHIVPLLYVNTVGMQNTGKNVLAFDGGSTAYDSQGSVTAQLRDDFQESLEIIHLGKPGTQVPSDQDKLLDALVCTIRRFDEQLFPFKPKWVIGLSGGIDSSITASLLRLSLDDPTRIVGYNLATRYNSDVTKANAYRLAQALGIRLVNGSIEEIVTATDSVLDLYGYPDEQIGQLAQENIQARLRGHMLSTFAQVEGGVIMNNGNKVEIMMGYATLYGDAIGAISPLGDLTKVQLFDLAQDINRRLGCEAIPANLVPTETETGFDWQTMPSAELKDNQRDPMKWFYHDWLVHKLTDYPGYGIEQVMEAYLHDKLATSPVGKWVRFYGLDDPQAFIEDLEWVLHQMRVSVFKRIQMPPILTISRGSFGFDFRENQAAYEQTDRYRDLKAKILARR
ncbi:MAG: NAD(+) synthase [Eggerthellaceae bacterium]|jgi:NAD+ synthase (glutamine-hydrolysing)